MSEADVLLAVVAEDRVTALLYRTGADFTLETVVWPAVWGTRSLFSRAITPHEAKVWMEAHGVEIETEESG